jgi:hypothetical protein
VRKIQWVYKGAKTAYFYNVSRCSVKVNGRATTFTIELGKEGKASKSSPRKIALLITITYALLPKGKGRLPGCRNDGYTMNEFLQNLGFEVIWVKDFEMTGSPTAGLPPGWREKTSSTGKGTYYMNNNTGVTQWTRPGAAKLKSLPYNHDMYPSAKNIKQIIERIVKTQRKGDVFWFQYSGHGGQLKDDNGDEEDGKDEGLVSADYKNPSAWQRGRGDHIFVRDDWLKTNMVDKLNRVGTETMIVTDCCHSASMADMEYEYDDRSKRMKKLPSTGRTHGTGKAVLLTGCKDTETAKETAAGGGALTAAFTECLNKNKNVTVKGLLTYVVDKTRRRNQRPCLSASYNLKLDDPFYKLIDGL